MTHPTAQVLMKEHALCNLVIGLANPHLFLLMSELHSERDTQDKLRGVTTGGPLRGLYPYFTKDTGSERFSNSLGSHSQERAELGLSHCS